MAKAAKKIAKKTGDKISLFAAKQGAQGTTGAFVDMLFPFLMQVLSTCLTPKPTPTPQPSTSAASPEAWKTADESKVFAISKIKSGGETDQTVTYKRTGNNAAIRRIMKQQRQSGKTMTRDEAESYIHGHLDAARLLDLEENAVYIDSNK